FFAKNSEVPAELASYFASFDLIVSYLYDPDRIFENNLRRCGVKNLLCGPAKIVEKGGHAAKQLARPIEESGIKVTDFAERIFLSVDDRHFAQAFLSNLSRPVVAIHPGSGSDTKNWPLQNWIMLFSSNAATVFSLIIVSGEADEAHIAQLEHVWKDRDVRFAKNLPLPHLAAVLEHTIFVGHDSGISHLAAAGGPSYLLPFGPTDPDVWAPKNENVQVLQAQSGRVHDLQTASVEAAVAAALSRCLKENAPG